MSPTISARLVPRTTAGVVEHLVHRHADGRVVSQQDLRQRVADEDQRDPGLVDDRAVG